jgi:predicted metal-dependent HD superfamily phosphohydrolase
MEQLARCYQEPHRHYHTLQHLNECLGKLEPVLGLAANAGEVELALWFHDAIYDVQRQDNELRSGIWARDAALAGGVTPQSAQSIHDLVMATRHDAIPAAPDARLVVDVDLSILGAAAPLFDEYERQIRQEYNWVPSLIFKQKRCAILREFLGRPRIFSTDCFHNALEHNARENLQRSIDQLGG